MIDPGVAIAGGAAALTYMAKTIYELVRDRREDDVRRRDQARRTFVPNGATSTCKAADIAAAHDQFQERLWPMVEAQTRVLEKIEAGQSSTNESLTRLVTIMDERRPAPARRRGG